MRRGLGVNQDPGFEETGHMETVDKIAENGRNEEVGTEEQSPWPHLEEFYAFEGRKGYSVLMRCRLCLTRRVISAYKNSASNLKKHIERRHPEKLDQYRDTSVTAARQRKDAATLNRHLAAGVASSQDDVTLHLQCPLCGTFSKSHAHLLSHTANAHPALLEDTAVGRLGNVIIYQSYAQLFHCSQCFFTSKEFPKLYDHLIIRHCTMGQQEAEGDPETSEGAEEENEASLKQKRSSDEEEEGHNDENSDLRPPAGSQTAEESDILLFDGSAYRCRVCGWKHKLKALGIRHVLKRHNVPKAYAEWLLKQDRDILNPTHTGGGEKEEGRQREKPHLLTQELLKEDMEAMAKVLHYINNHFVCRLCGWKNKLKAFAISHVVHGHKVERLYSCSECKCAFFLPSQLRQHQDSQHRPGRYLCPFCLFRSDYLKGFRRHCSRCYARGDDEGDAAEESDEDHGQMIRREEEAAEEDGDHQK